MIYIHFRQNESFTIPNLRTQREPKLFSFFPKHKSLIQLYYNEQIKAGSLSMDTVICEIRSVIIPKLYDNLLTEAADNKDMMPCYDELLNVLDLKTLVSSPSHYTTGTLINVANRDTRRIPNGTTDKLQVSTTIKEPLNNE